MRLLIAGWHGQIARAIIEAAPGRADVTGVSMGTAAFDLCKPSTIRSTFDDARPDIMINTAAYTAVDRAESEPDEVFQLNSVGAETFAEVAAKRSIPVIHLSSGYVFDGSKSEPYTEADAPAPLAVYGRSKLEGERAVCGSNPAHIILRTSWLHSANGRNFVLSILQRARNGGRIEVVDDQTGCPTYAPHLAQAILDIAAAVASGRVSEPWGIYNAASSGEATWCAFARAVFEISDRIGGPSAEVVPIASEHYPTSAPRLANARLDCTRLRQTFGIALPDWREGVEACVREILRPPAG